jgi:hypothetical protein
MEKCYCQPRRKSKKEGNGNKHKGDGNKHEQKKNMKKRTIIISTMKRTQKGEQC